MQYEVEIGGRVRQVTLARTGDTFAVTLDGRTCHVDVARIDRHTLSLVVDTVWSKNVTISSDAPGQMAGQMTVLVGTTPVPVTVNDRRRNRRRDEGGGSGTGPQRVVAPMPGKVLRVLVKPGDPVVARQPLAVIEAMKMENELRAARDGLVAEVHAREGASVDAGALLIIIQ